MITSRRPVGAIRKALGREKDPIQFWLFLSLIFIYFSYTFLHIYINMTIGYPYSLWSIMTIRLNIVAFIYKKNAKIKLYSLFGNPKGMHRNFYFVLQPAKILILLIVIIIRQCLTRVTFLKLDTFGFTLFSAYHLHIQ